MMADGTSPEISIIVPVYNVEQYLRRCLDSIRAQTFTDWECILIDDGSPDASGAVCDEYAAKDCRFRVIHQENRGVSAARNAGLDAARGEWIAFVDSDDWIEPSFLAEQVSDSADGTFDAVVCGLYGRGKPRHTELNREAAKRSVFKRGGFGGFSVLRLIRRRNVGSLRFDESVSYMEDVLFFWKFFNCCDKILWTDKPLYHYEQNETSVTHQPGLTVQAKTAVKALNYIIANEKDRSVRNLVKSSLRNFYNSCLITYIYSRQGTPGFEECLSKVRLNFFRTLTDVRLPVKTKLAVTLLLLDPDFEKNLFARAKRRRQERKSGGAE